jgi:hypothetical protein
MKRYGYIMNKYVILEFTFNFLYKHLINEYLFFIV